MGREEAPMPDLELINGWRVLESAPCRYESTPRIVLCKDPTGAQCFIVALVTSQGDMLGHFHARYSSALAAFRVRCALDGTTTH
jgi:hypothetical protein